jgi:fibronectin type 3 domain-containing protein
MTTTQTPTGLALGNPLAAPVTVAATTDQTTKIAVTWAAVTGAISYSVWRGTNINGTGATSLASGLTGTSYDDTTPNAETFYYYFVKATHGAGTSALSGAATGWRVGAAPGAFAAGTDATDDQSGYVEVSWGAAAGAVRYDILRDGVPIGSVGPTVFSFVDEDVVAETEYTYEVVAWNYNGTRSGGTDSGMAAISPPTGVTASDGTYPSMVRVYWDGVAGAVSYNVYKDGAYVGNTGDTTFDVPVASGASHVFTVRTVGSTTTSDYSDGDYGYAAALQPPTGVDATDTDFDNVEVSWTIVDGADSYNVYKNGSLIASGVTGLSYIDEPTPGTYAYTVRSVNSLESSALSASDNGTRVQVQDPSGLSATTDEVDQVTLDWAAAAGAVSYNIYKDGSLIASGITGTSHIVTTGITNCVGAYYAVQTYRSADNYSDLSASSQFGKSLPTAEFCHGGGLSVSGGESGYDQTFNWCGAATYIHFNAYTIKDRLKIYVGGFLVYDTGCISGEVTQVVSSSSGTALRIVVEAHCDGGDVGTSDWNLEISC